MDNKEFAEKDVKFNNACASLDMKATTRQASKWRMGKGRAYKVAILKQKI